MFRPGVRAEGHSEHVIDSAIEHVHVECVRRRVEISNDRSARGDDDLRMGEIGVPSVSAQHLIVRGILEAEEIEVVAVNGRVRDVVVERGHFAPRHLRFADGVDRSNVGLTVGRNAAVDEP